MKNNGKSRFLLTMAGVIGFTLFGFLAAGNARDNQKSLGINKAEARQTVRGDRTRQIVRADRTRFDNRVLGARDFRFDRQTRRDNRRFVRDNRLFPRQIRRDYRHFRRFDRRVLGAYTAAPYAGVPYTRVAPVYVQNVIPATQPYSVAAATRRVSIQNFDYSPNNISVRAGSTVVWTNYDSVPHTVTDISGSFNSGVISPGSTYRLTLSNPGTYYYYCTLHPNMRGTVTVTSYDMGKYYQRYDYSDYEPNIQSVAAAATYDTYGQNGYRYYSDQDTTVLGARAYAPTAYAADYTIPASKDCNCTVNITVGR